MKPTNFDAQAGQFFPSVDEAADWTRNYRDKHPRLAADGSAKKVLYATYFGNDFLQKIMGQPGCVGLRFYKATDSDKDSHILVVGVDKDGNDLVRRKNENGEETEEVMVGNWGVQCPTWCSTGPLSGN
jgi:hypothetical protein